MFTVLIYDCVNAREVEADFDFRTVVVAEFVRLVYHISKVLVSRRRTAVGQRSTNTGEFS